MRTANLHSSPIILITVFNAPYARKPHQKSMHSLGSGSTPLRFWSWSCSCNLSLGLVCCYSPVKLHTCSWWSTRQLQFCVTTVARSVLWSCWCHRPDGHLRRGRPRRLATAWTGGCMQSGPSTHKTRPHLVQPLWLVTRNWSLCYMCMVASVAVASNEWLSLHLLLPCWRATGIRARYRKVDKSTINITVLHNRYDPLMTVICHLKDPVGDRVPSCCPITNNTSFNSVSERSCLTFSRHGILWSSWHRSPDDHLHCRPPWRSAAWVIRGG